MPPIQYKLGANHRKKHYHAFKRNKKPREWLWLFAFWVICACNGWFLTVSRGTSPEVRVFFVFFAIFPISFIFYALYTRLAKKLFATVHHTDGINSVFKQTIMIWYSWSTFFVKLLLIVSWLLLAFIIGNFDLNITYYPVTSVLIYGIIFFFFIFVFMDSLSETGLSILLFMGVIVSLLLLISDWEKVFRLIWYCNFMITTSNAGVRLQQYSNSFLKAMIALIGTAILGLAIGWNFARMGI